MKKLALLALLCLSFAAAHAANIVNRTKCTIVINPVCYDPITCAFAPCGTVQVVPPGTTLPLTPGCHCPFPNLLGFSVCWGDPACAGCVAISSAAGGPCAAFPMGDILPPCPVCPFVTGQVSWNAAGDLVIK